MNNLNIRIRFSKIGSIRFISHLDLNRTVARAIRRANLPIAYSEGFNPRPKLVFGLNVSVGTESTCEILDTQFTEYIPYQTIKERLNSVLPIGLEVYDVYEHDMPLKTIAYAEYEIYIPTEMNLVKATKEVFEGNLVILKRTKSSELMTDISQNIKSVEISGTDTALNITAVITAGNNDYLNPEYLVKGISSKIAPQIIDTDYRIMRRYIYNVNRELFN